MLVLLGVLIIGLILRRIGRSLEEALRESRRAEQTVVYNDNRQYHYTEVHNGSRPEDHRSEDRRDRDSAAWRF